MILLPQPPPVYSQQANLCRSCSPIHCAIGEPDAICSRCSGPIEPTDAELAATRAARNAYSLARLIP